MMTQFIRDTLEAMKTGFSIGAGVAAFLVPVGAVCLVFSWVMP